jgi:hypothetical protein
MQNEYEVWETEVHVGNKAWGISNLIISIKFSLRDWCNIRREHSGKSHCFFPCFFHIPFQPFIYCHVMEWLHTGLGLMTGFIAHFDSARDYTLQFSITHTLASSVTSSMPLLGRGFQRRMFPSSGFPNCPRPQLLEAHHNWAPVVLELTHTLH